MKSTSKEAIRAIAKTLPKKRAFAFSLVERYPLRTARELEAMAADWSLHKRLAELEGQGLIVADGTTPCPISGRKATAWRIALERDGVEAKARPERVNLRKAVYDAVTMLLVAASGTPPAQDEAREMAFRLRKAVR